MSKCQNKEIGVEFYSKTSKTDLFCCSRQCSSQEEHAYRICLYIL